MSDAHTSAHLDRLRAATASDTDTRLADVEPRPLVKDAPGEADQDYHPAPAPDKDDADHDYTSEWHRRIAEVGLTPGEARVIIDTLILQQRAYTKTYPLFQRASVTLQTTTMRDSEAEHSIAEQLQPHYTETLMFVRQRERMTQMVASLNGEDWTQLSRKERMERVNEMSAPLYSMVLRKVNEFTNLMAAVFSEGYERAF